MKNSILTIIFWCIATVFAYGQISQIPEYEPSAQFPFGRMNPKAEKELSDFAPLIGDCDCKSVSRKPDKTWADTVSMIWRFKYIMNGTAIQDETWKADSTYSGSIRQYQADSATWVITYFSYPAVSTSPGVWTGGKSEGKIVLTKPQQAPNGMNGATVLTFYDISDAGYKWKCVWVHESGKFEYPTWTIDCKKRL